MDIVNEYRNWLSNEQKLSKSTIEVYLATLRNFLTYYKDFESRLEKHMVDYYIFMQDTEGVPSATINSRIAGLKKFNEFLVMNNYQDEIVIKPSSRIQEKRKKSQPEPPSNLELEKFFNAIKQKGSKRDLAIAVLILNTNVSVPEIITLKVEDYDGKTVRIDKGMQKDVYPIDDETRKVLNDYLKDRMRFSTSDSDMLFISQMSKSMEEKSIFRLFRKYSLLAELPTPITPKKLSLYNNKLENFQSHINYEYTIDNDVNLNIDILSSNFEDALFVSVKVSVLYKKEEKVFYFVIGKPEIVPTIVQKRGVAFIPKGWIFMPSLIKEEIKTALINNFYINNDLKVDFISNLEKYSLEFDKLSLIGL